MFLNDDDQLGVLIVQAVHVPLLQATLSEDWGISCTAPDMWSDRSKESRERSTGRHEADLSDLWTSKSKGFCDADIGTAARASFSVALGWSDIVMRIQGMLPMSDVRDYDSDAQGVGLGVE